MTLRRGAIGDEFLFMKKWTLALISLSLVLAIAGAVSALVHYFLFTRPLIMARSFIPPSGAELVENADGTLTLSWPEANKADNYLIELRDENKLLWSKSVVETSCLMPGDLKSDGDVLLNIIPRVIFETPDGKFYRECDRPLTASYPAAIPSFDGLSMDVDPDKDTLTITWDAVKGGVYTVFDENGKELAKTNIGGVSLHFGAILPIPAKDELVRLSLTCDLEGFDVGFKSGVTAAVEMPGELLRDIALQTNVVDLGNNLYRLKWNETRGDRYEVLVRNGTGDWRKVGAYTDQDGRSCVLGPLEPFADYGIRVTAVGGCATDENGFSAMSDEVNVTTGATTLYATIWVLKDLTIWSDTSMSKKVGVATTDMSYCVMDDRDGFFLIYTDGAKGWIDSTYCLINLPDYMGELAEYDIRNSYDSAYMVSNYGIPGITGTVIGGYEEVGLNYSAVKSQRTVRVETEEPDPVEGETEETHEDDAGSGDVNMDADGGIDGALKPAYEMSEVEIQKPGDFLVPLLYPTAIKVMSAALAAREDGYRLKIYDAYRPYVATRFLYDLAESLLANEVPERTYSEMAGDMWDDYVAGLTEPDDVPGADDTEDAENTDADIDEEGEPEEPRPNYYTVMTNGRFALSAFLAKSGSYHNLGIAIDLTLVDADTDEELQMQTAMHDLSWNSVLTFNNENAKLLAKYMTGSGLAPLSSEWWHFQDDELRGRVKDLTRRQDGVTRSGWLYDGAGWRYRTLDGEYLKNGTYAVNGIQYNFNLLGYSDYAKWDS